MVTVLVSGMKCLVITLAFSELMVYMLVLIVLGMGMTMPEAFKQVLDAVGALLRKRS